ncbi:hypothetical protein, partial [Xanthomonas phaseoli]|uniref:hypothetical protein n=1 Tax=Xanthomonas phaseoli TaxID=1985254 RepID=UPI001AD97CAD
METLDMGSPGNMQGSVHGGGRHRPATQCAAGHGTSTRQILIDQVFVRFLAAADLLGRIAGR